MPHNCMCTLVWSHVQWLNEPHSASSVKEHRENWYLRRVKLCCSPACCSILLHIFHKRCYYFVYHDSCENPSSNAHWIKLLKLNFYDTTRIIRSKVKHWERQNYWDLIKCFNVNLPLATISFEGILSSCFTCQNLLVASQVHMELFAAHPEAVQSIKHR